jgi:hypothetical protein
MLGRLEQAAIPTKEAALASTAVRAKAQFYAYTWNICTEFRRICPAQEGMCERQLGRDIADSRESHCY